MSFWVWDKGKKVYAGGQDDYSTAAQLAGACPFFREDYVEELMAEEAVSCYNCRYRKWTAESFICLKGTEEPNPG